MAPPAAVGASSAAAIAGLSKVGSPLAENEMVGASGAFNALAEAVKSGPSAGRPEAEAPGGADAAPESRLGLGGGASLRDSGGVESCVPCTPSSTPLPASARAAASTTESAEPGEDSSVGGSAGPVTPTCAVSSECSIVIQLSTAIHRSAPCRVGDRRSAPARARPPRSNPGETCQFLGREPRSSADSPDANPAPPTDGRGAP